MLLVLTVTTEQHQNVESYLNNNNQHRNMLFKDSSDSVTDTVSVYINIVIDIDIMFCCYC